MAPFEPNHRVGGLDVLVCTTGTRRRRHDMVEGGPFTLHVVSAVDHPAAELFWCVDMQLFCGNPPRR